MPSPLPSPPLPSQVMHGGRLLTLFSARDYLRAGSNDSALLLAAFDADGALRIRPKRLVRSLAAAATRMVPPTHPPRSASALSARGGF